MIKMSKKVKHRGVFFVLLMSCCTCGFYALYWLIATKNEMNSLKADIPTGWLLIIPILNIWWLYKYCVGFEKVGKTDTSAIMLFLIYIIFSPAAVYIVQNALNALAKKK